MDVCCSAQDSPNVDYKAEMDRAKELARGDKMKKLYKDLMKVEMPAIED